MVWALTILGEHASSSKFLAKHFAIAPICFRCASRSARVIGVAFSRSRWQCLCFFPEPHQHGSFLPVFSFVILACLSCAAPSPSCWVCLDFVQFPLARSSARTCPSCDSLLTKAAASSAGGCTRRRRPSAPECVLYVLQQLLLRSFGRILLMYSVYQFSSNRGPELCGAQRPLAVSRRNPVRTRYLATISSLPPPSLFAQTHISIGARSRYLGRLRASWINSSARIRFGTVASVKVPRHG